MTLDEVGVLVGEHGGEFVVVQCRQRTGGEHDPGGVAADTTGQAVHGGRRVVEDVAVAGPGRRPRT